MTNWQMYLKQLYTYVRANSILTIIFSKRSWGKEKARKIKPRKHSWVHTWTQGVNVFVRECVCALNGNVLTTKWRRPHVVVVSLSSSSASDGFRMCHLLSEFRLTKWCAQKKRRSDERQNTFKRKNTYVCVCKNT